MTDSWPPPPPPPPPPYWGAYGQPPVAQEAFPQQFAQPRRHSNQVLALVLVVAMVLTGGIGVAAGAALRSRLAAPARPTLGTGQSPVLTPPSQSPFFGGGNNGNSGNGNNGSGTANGELDASRVASKVEPGVVDITVTLANQGGQAAGTGMVVTSSGEVVTNNHVIENASEIRAQVDGAGTVYTAKVIGYDIAHDVALLQLNKASGLHPVAFGDSDNVGVNDPVLSIGNALGRGGAPAVTQGLVTGLNQQVTAADDEGEAETLTGMIEVRAGIVPGDSGGPIANAKGEVIAMTTAGSEGARRRFAASSLGFGVPSNTVRSIISQIEAGKSSEAIHIGDRALLGVALNPLGGRNSGSSGAAVQNVSSGSPAASAGIKAGDTIVSIGGKAVGSANDVRTVLNLYHPGDKVAVAWVDTGGQRHQSTVKMVVGPPA